MNTSGEESKYGVQPNECTALARHIRDTCAHLRFAGLMTIGQPDYSSRPENFQVFTYTLNTLDSETPLVIVAPREHPGARGRGRSGSGKDVLF